MRSTVVIERRNGGQVACVLHSQNFIRLHENSLSLKVTSAQGRTRFGALSLPSQVHYRLAVSQLSSVIKA